MAATSAGSATLSSATGASASALRGRGLGHAVLRSGCVVLGGAGGFGCVGRDRCVRVRLRGRGLGHAVLRSGCVVLGGAVGFGCVGRDRCVGPRLEGVRLRGRGLGRVRS
ncbi:hypothetical protein CGZ69_18385 [Streptomyces peucetius subsp. caesius ATCC 27952]|nr:hypothetical protein CGZ69_18385 [Streptomyces peucetius subsp. caesius ATCC 27952]